MHASCDVVLLDALGTLVELPPPAPALVEELAIRGVTVDEREAVAAMRAEIAFYRSRLHEARDGEALARLRVACTEVLRAELPPAARGLPADGLQAALLGALRFRAFAEVPDALRALRAAGLRLVVASNWDVSLHEVLARTGLEPLVDGAVSSAEVGHAKPAAALFAAALGVAGDGASVPAAAAVHVGDSVEHDVAGALGAGLGAVLVARDAAAGPPPAVPAGVAVVGSLAELPALLAPDGP